MEDVKNRLICILEENGLINNENKEQFLSGNISALGATSIIFIKLVVTIEDEFDIEFDDMELDYQLFNTVDDLVALIAKKIDSQSEDE